MLSLAGPAQAELDPVELTFGAVTVTLEVALTPAEHSKGLSERDEIPDGTGMVFDFERPRSTCFWMRNTLVPLEAIFISNSGAVLQISRMQPRSLEQHCVREKVRWVLEFPDGWMAKEGIDLHKARLSPANLAKLEAIR